ncbi:MAG: hypothetical protein H6815_00440 [Phycisphaeraceae bacterium]|nr:hypothetical protein [Phycisphaerales bacterium]MCB9858892.1 hypothetical protein [Phycisphaeraceae bacterium]
MAGSNEIERAASQIASRRGGMTRVYNVPLSSLLISTRALIGTGTAPKVAALATSLDMIEWVTANGAANFVTAEFVVPDTYASEKTGLVVRMLARKAVGSGDENTDLKLSATPYWFTPGSDTAVQTLSAAVTQTLSAAVTEADLSGFAWYEFDLGAAMRDESKTIEGGDICKLLIGPNETVGSDSMTLQVAGIEVWSREHLAMSTPARNNI